MNEQPITIIYVDRNTLRRNKAEALVHKQISSAIFVHAPSYDDGIKELKARDADVVVVELELPFPKAKDSLHPTAGLQFIPEAQARRPGTPIIALSVSPSASIKDACEQNGVHLLDRGKTYFPKLLVTRLRVGITTRGKTPGAVPA